MKFEKTDFFRLRRPAAMSAIAILLAAAMAAYARQALTEAQAQKELADSSQRQSNAALQQNEAESRDAAELARLFLDLRHKGVIGEERRLAWMDRLGTWQAQFSLSRFDYEFAPARALPAGKPGETLFASRMRLRTAPLHEVELLELLRRIEDEAPAIITLRSCRLARTGDDAESLEADCEMDWITAGQPGKARSR